MSAPERAPSGAEVNAVRLSDTYRRLRELARVADGGGARGMSTGEACAVALLCNDPGLLPIDYTMLDAVGRIDGEWLTACLQLNRDGWRE